MPDRDIELIRAAVHAAARLVVAVEHVDHDQIAAAVGELLRAATRYNAAGITAERRDDAALIHAIARLGGT